MESIWMPRVSIVIPVYNGANYMREAIDSALAQSYENIEVIVVNDGSVDNGATREIALSYGDRIRYFEKENGGVSSALNYGICQMTGEYFSWLSHDDVYGPDKVKRQVENLRTYGSDRTIAMCAHCFINEASQQIKKAVRKRFSNGLVEWDAVLLSAMKYGTFNGCAMLIPKSVFEECGLFHERLRYSQDALMWMQIFCKGYHMVYSGDTDVFSRIHGKQLTQTGKALFRKDSLTIAEIMVPQLVERSKKDTNFLHFFANRQALFGNREVVDVCIAAGKNEKLISVFQTVVLRLKLVYGIARPAFRKVYYRVFVKGASL